jgi:hypothetical protein
MSSISADLLDQAKDEVLTFIEQREAEIIAYGLYDVTVRGQDVLDRLIPSPDLVQRAGLVPLDEVLRLALRDLVHTQQVIRFDDNPDPTHYVMRSRIAETVRLVNLVRQRLASFPGQMQQPLGASPRLVDNLKYAVQVRRVPRRDIPVSTILAHLLSAPASAIIDAERATVSEILLSVIDQRLPKLRLMSGFQRRAFEALSDILEVQDQQRAEKGIVVTAGTGAGKTYAFFLPLLAKVLLERSLRQHSGVKAICIYPRVALSENQLGDFIEILYHLNRELRQRNLPEVSIGIESGAAVYQSSDFQKTDEQSRNGLKRQRGWVYDEGLQGYKCPFAFSVQRDADGHPVRLFVRPSQSDQLICPITGERYTFIRFARDVMAAYPPDILIATTESLNKRLMDAQYQHLFGTDAVAPPSVIMLDEIHLQTSTAGSQVALLLRRLLVRLRVSRQERDERQNLAFVGLSATIAQPTEFLAELTGISPTQITRIQPDDEEMQAIGAERYIFVRAAEKEDTANISTLIQTTMAILHTMPTPPDDSDLKRYRTFGFVQSLDIVSRWYYQMQDAERGRPDQVQARRRLHDARRDLLSWPSKDIPLFAYRRPPYNHLLFPQLVGQAVNCDCYKRARPDPACPLFRAGECWWVLSQQGAAVATPLTIQRKSGSDRHVQISEADDLIITTSALEVGYDDDALMCVIQYQAPANIASFVQRKGRGGRKVGTRPIVATVLSPYRNTDVFLFRNSHLLTEPTFHKLPLNAQNRFLQRIHGFYALFDWLAYRAHRDGVRLDIGSVTPLSLRYLLDLFDNPDSLVAAQTYLQGALRASDPQVIPQLLADNSEGILHILADIVLNTARERLGKGESDFFSGGQPSVKNEDALRPYLPDNLFSNINLPEVQVNFTPAYHPGTFKSESISLALSETIPGNVTYRGGSEATWIPPLGEHGRIPRLALSRHYTAYHQIEQSVSVANLPERALRLLGIDRHMQRRLTVYRPTRIEPEPFRQDLKASLWIGDPTTEAIRHCGDDDPIPQGWLRLSATSTGYAIGAVSISTDRQPGRQYRLNERSGAISGEALPRSLLQAVDLHSDEPYNQSPISVLRIILGSQYSIKFSGQADPIDGVVGFSLNPGDIAYGAIGYDMLTEGIRFQVRDEVLDGLSLPPTLEQRLMDNFVRHAFVVEVTSTHGANIFIAQYAVGILALIAATQDAATDGVLPDWFVSGHSEFDNWVQVALDRAFALSRKSRLAVTRLLAESAVVESFVSLYAEMHRRGPRFASYLRDCFVYTMTQALQQAAQDVAGVEALNYVAAWTELDRDYPQRSQNDIWLYEIGEGGIGVMRAAQQLLRAHPARFWALVDQHASTCETARDEAFLRHLLAQDEAWLSDLADIVEQLRDPQYGAQGGDLLSTLLGIVRSRLGTLVRETQIKSILRVFIPDYDTAPSAVVANWRLYREVNAIGLSRAEALLKRAPTVQEVRSLLLRAVEQAPADYPTLDRLKQHYVATSPAEDRELLGRAIEQRVLLTCRDNCPTCLGDRSGGIEGPTLAPFLLSRPLLRHWLESVRIRTIVSLADHLGPANLCTDLAAIFEEGWTEVRLRVPAGHMDTLTGALAYLSDAGIETRFGLYYPTITRIQTLYDDNLAGMPHVEATLRLAGPESS